MQKLTVQITNSSALKALRGLGEKHFIKIVKCPDLSSPSLPGKEMDLPAFEAWISYAESARTVTLKDAKSRWVPRKKQLQKNCEVRVSLNALPNIEELRYIAFLRQLMHYFSFAL
jgi:hypothetical protein